MRTGRDNRYVSLLAVALLTSVALGGCFRAAAPIGVPLPSDTRFENEWKNYSRLRPNKAMAIAGDTAGVYVAGYAFGHATDLAAVSAALEACEARRSDRRIESQCRTYAVGNEPVETASLGDAKIR